MAKNKEYFGEIEEEKIKEFIAEKDLKRRNYIFNRWLYNSFRKIAEYMVNKGHFYPSLKIPSEQLIDDVISYMYSQLPNYDEKKGRAFTFLTMTAQFYLLSMVSKNNRSDNIEVSYFEMNTFFDKNHYNLEDYKKRERILKFYKKFIEILKNNKNIFFTENYEFLLIDYFIEVFNHSSEFAMNFGKQKFYFFVKEYETDILQKQVYKFLDKVLQIFLLVKNFYEENGYIDEDFIINQYLKYNTK